MKTITFLLLIIALAEVANTALYVWQLRSSSKLTKKEKGNAKKK